MNPSSLFDTYSIVYCIQWAIANLIASNKAILDQIVINVDVCYKYCRISMEFLDEML